MKTWHVLFNGKEISKHKDFYNAYCALKKHFKNKKVNNNYEAVPIEFNSLKEYLEYAKKDVKNIHHFIHLYFLQKLRRKSDQAKGN